MKPNEWQVAHKDTQSTYLPGHPQLLPTPRPWQRLYVLHTHRDHQPLTPAMQKGRSLLGFPSRSVVNAMGNAGAQPAASQTGHPGHCESQSQGTWSGKADDCLMLHQTHKPSSRPLQLFSSQGSADHQFLLPFSCMGHRKNISALKTRV